MKYTTRVKAKSLYEQIAENFGDVLGEDAELFKKLAKEEEGHAKLVERFVDRAMRII
ncbi:ferritin family protein [Archaeoglobus sp.]